MCNPYSTPSCREGFARAGRRRTASPSLSSSPLPPGRRAGSGLPPQRRARLVVQGEAPPRPRAGSVVPGPGAVRAPCPGPPLRTAGGCPSQPSRLRSCLDPERGVGGGKDCQAWDPERRRGVGQRQGRAAAWAAACGSQSARSRAQEVRVHAAAGSRARSPGGCFRQTVMLLWALHDGSPNGRR